jgi:hypothetical protein
MIASKVICDDTYSNKLWSIGTGDVSAARGELDGAGSVSVPRLGIQRRAFDITDEVRRLPYGAAIWRNYNALQATEEKAENARLPPPLVLSHWATS